jgi:tetratricopeptide (TPR) repeat protein
MKKLLLILLVISNQSFSQSLKQSALKNYNNQNWEAAAKEYLKYLKKNDGDSSDWYNLAMSKAKLKDFNKAIEFFKESEKRNFTPAFVYYNIAKSYAQMNDEANLINALQEGANKGLRGYSRLQSDPAFAAFQKSKTFIAVLEKIKVNAYPCLSSKDNRHFDFWLGEWNVFVGTQKVGVNSITMALGGCAVHENYATGGNYAGQSINYYDPIDKKWHQHWVGSGGDVYNYLETKREEGLLQFESKFMGPQGNISLSRLTFTLNDDGTVKQLFEGSTDEGKTWAPAFDGLYKKKD